MRPAFGTGNFFAVLGARAALGRTFTDAETWRTGQSVAVLSHRLWRDRFGSDPARHRPDRSARRKPGADRRRDAGRLRVPAPSRSTCGSRWAWNPNNRQQTFFRRAHWLSVDRAREARRDAERRPNAQLQAVVEATAEASTRRRTRSMGAGMTPLHEFLVGDTRLPLLVLLGAVGLLLLIACANVGNLMLVQGGRPRA